MKFLNGIKEYFSNKEPALIKHWVTSFSLEDEVKECFKDMNSRSYKMYIETDIDGYIFFSILGDYFILDKIIIFLNKGVDKNVNKYNIKYLEVHIKDFKTNKKHNHIFYINKGEI